MKLDHLEFLAAFLPGAERSLTRTGIQVHSLDYWDEALSPWVGQNKRVLVTWDPRDISFVYVRTPGGVLVRAALTTLEVRRMSLAEWDARKAWERTLAKDPAMQKQADESLLRGHALVLEARRTRRTERRRATAAAGDRYMPPSPQAPPTPSTDAADPVTPWITDNSELFDVEETTYDF
ncbi:Mu transposase C-terminal domain-containing protein [Pseudoxanthomonas mexicana]|uniref:Mu transposase C-terminal domain-containing protein n=1 Tax=Pseudoxanthomonas mexicana TaxID=128785 RepID=UPI0028A1C73C|nr:Mu transposase C-terminal domain-containing protein [Pseudoxanthomonas mexicana]